MNSKAKKIVIVAAIAAVASAALAIGLAFALAPAPAFAAGHPWMFGPHRGFGPWNHAGPMMWQQGWNGNSFGYMTSGNESKANWTGTVSISSLKAGIIDTIKSNVKVDLADAASAAEKALGSGGRVGAITLAPVNGYLVYQAYGIDSSNNIHRLIIDVGKGNLLENNQINMATGYGLWHGSGMFGGSGGIWK